MHLVPSALALALPLFLSLPSVDSEAPLAGTPETTIARLVPDGATILLRAGSLEKLDRLARDMVGAVEPDELEGFDVKGLLAEMEVPGDLSLVDTTRPIAMSMSLSLQGPPSSTAIVPVTDAAGYGASLGGMTWHELDGYVGVSTAAGYATRAEPHPLAMGLPQTAVAARLDLDEILAMYAPMIEFGLTQIEQLANAQAPSPDVDMGPMIDWYIEGIEDFIDSADVLDLGLVTRGSQLDGTFLLTIHQDSPMSACAGEGPTGVAKLAGCIDTSDSMAFLGGIDLAGLMSSFEGLTEAAFGLYPEPMRDQLRAMMTAFEDIYPLMGDAFAGSGAFGSDGMRFAYYLDSSDPQKLIETYAEAFSALAGSEGLFELEQLPSERRGEIDVSRFHMRVTDEGMKALQGEAVDEEALAQLRGMIDAIYGKDGMRFAMAGKGKRVAFAMGGDEAFLDGVLGRLDASGPSAEKIRPMVSRIADANPCMLFHMDLAEVMGQMTKAMGPVMGGMGEMPDLSGLSAPMLLYAGVRGAAWSGGASFDLARMAELVGAMNQ